MDYEQKKAAGILLCTIGFWFYCQSTLDAGYLHATRNDFAHLYLAGYLAERGGNFFDDHLLLNTHRHLNIPTGLNPFVYPPFFGLLLIPLSKFSYDMAWLLFTMLSHAAYFAALALMVRLIRQDEEPGIFWWGVLMALSACYYPLVKTYSAGQMNTFMLLLVTGGAYLLRDNRQFEAGCLFGLGAAIKVTPAFFLLYCCWTRRWRAAAAGGTVLGISILISLLSMGVEVHGGFLSAMKDMGYGSSTWAQYQQTYHIDPFNQAPSAFWYRLFSHTETAQFGVIEGIFDAPLLAKILSYCTALSVLVLLGWYTKSHANEFSLMEFSLWSLGMLLLPSLLWDHYLVQALFAIVISLRTALYGAKRGAFWLGLAILILAMPYLHHYPSFRQGWMTLFMSIKLVGIVILGVYLIKHRPEESRSFSSEDHRIDSVLEF